MAIIIILCALSRQEAGEKITLLNDSEITLDDDTLVIADQNGPLALAGVMGGRVRWVIPRATSSWRAPFSRR